MKKESESFRPHPPEIRWAYRFRHGFRRSSLGFRNEYEVDDCRSCDWSRCCLGTDDEPLNSCRRDSNVV